jgi:hypothetical protein
MNTPEDAPVQKPNMPPLTPDELVLALNHRRDHIQTRLKLESADALAKQTQQPEFFSQFIRTFASAQRLVMHTIGADATSMTSMNAPKSAVKFIKSRPMLASVAIGTIVGAVILAGPKRVMGWASKLVTIWQISAAVRRG